MAYRTTHGVDTGIVRIFNTFGPRMRPNDGRAIPNFIRQALHDAPITVAGDARRRGPSAMWTTWSRASCALRQLPSPARST